MNSSKATLLYGEANATVLAEQAAWFASAGYTVEPAMGRQAIEQALQRKQFDVVVLGHTLSRDDRHHLPYMAKKSSEQARVLVLHASGRHPEVDAAIDSRRGRQEVLEAVATLLTRQFAGVV